MPEGAPAVSARTITPAPPRSALVVRSSVERGKGPHPGVYSPPYFWSDLLDGPSPPRPRRGEGSYVVYHTIAVDLDTRIRYATVVNVEPAPEDSKADTIVVDSRASVQHRLFLEMIHRERATMERLTSKWRERLMRGLVRQRHAAKRLPYAWMRRGARAAVKLEGRAGLALLRGVRGTSQALVETPDAIYSRWLAVRGNLDERLGRENLWRGMRDPANLSGEQKGVVLFLSAAVLFLAIFLLNNIIPIFLPFIASAYRDLLFAFIMGFATAVLLPFPPSELLVIAPYLSSGAVLAFAAIFASKVVGAWFVYFIGDALHSAIEKQTKGRPRTAASVAWMKTKAARFGAYILALFTAMPFLPDTLALYVFATTGMPFKRYLAGVAVGTAIRYALVVGILAFYGPEQVRALFG